MRHSHLPNKTDRFTKFKKNIDKILLQINTLSKSDKTKAFTYVYEHLQTVQTHKSNKNNKSPSRHKAKIAFSSKQPALIKKRKLKRKLKCPICNEAKDTKISLFKHLECLHVDVPLSCLKCRKTFNSQTSFSWHISNLCSRKKRILMKQFKCPECSKEFALRRHLLLHQAGHKKNNCSYCSTVLTRRSQLIRHLLVKHNVKLKRDTFKCDYCKKCFIKRRSLYHHLQNHLTSEFVCVECGAISKSLTDYQNHQEEHANRKPFQCSHCKQRFARRQLYFSHLNRHERYKCLTCKESFASKVRVYQHKSKGHNVKGLEPHLHCPYCRSTFCRTKLLEKHLVSHKEHLDETTCKHCNKVFNTLDQYFKHCFESRHPHVVKAEAYICEYCGQQYTKRYLLDQHLLKNHGKERGPYSCDHCDYTSKFKPNIARHVSLHFSKEKQFVCDHCGKFFSNGAVLTDHINYVHVQVKQFKCTMCEKSFKRNTELTRHQSTHSNLRPYNCVLCSNTYKRISHLRRHEKNIHGIINRTNKVQRLRTTEEEVSTPSDVIKKTTNSDQETVSLINLDFADIVVENELDGMTAIDSIIYNSEATPKNLTEEGNIEIIGLVDGLTSISNLEVVQNLYAF
ncbi:hypothetical protein RI129_002265 [Pyrocoelia pectoralis]|uniref:C2H2-type domain-containing protein n=1 Tax=Pyrocoelia pectoralis TaxID=417401 RepID=A0AAN7VMB7_9COLE